MVVVGGRVEASGASLLEDVVNTAVVRGSEAAAEGRV